MPVTCIIALKSQEPFRQSLKILLDNKNENLLANIISFTKVTDRFKTEICNRHSLIFVKNAGNVYRGSKSKKIFQRSFENPFSL